MITKHDRCVGDLICDAMQIAQDDPTILTGDYYAFERVMWVDDSGLAYHDMTREEYEDAMKDTWRLVKREQVEQEHNHDYDRA